jgi:hypothetical protein
LTYVPASKALSAKTTTDIRAMMAWPMLRSGRVCTSCAIIGPVLNPHCRYIMTAGPGAPSGAAAVKLLLWEANRSPLPQLDFTRHLVERDHAGTG